MRYELESLDTGRYTAYFVSPLGRIRLGTISGTAGRWFADRRGLARQLGPFKTRGQAAKALDHAASAATPMPRTGTYS